MIHPTAILTGDIDLAPDVEIGPYCVLDGTIRIGAGARLIGAVHILGPVQIGSGAVLHPHVCIGFRAQDFKFAAGAPTAGVIIGEGCQLREQATIHAATNDHTPTRIGDRAYMMVAAHVGHDAQLGDDITMVNAAVVGGHARIADRVILSGLSAVHQHTRIGRMAMLAGLSGVSQDVPPFCIADGANGLAGVNLVGLRRAGVGRDEINALRNAYRRILRRRMPRADAVSMLEEIAAGSPMVAEVARFVAESTRGICSGSPTRRHGLPPMEAAS